MAQKIYQIRVVILRLRLIEISRLLLAKLWLRAVNPGPQLQMDASDPFIRQRSVPDWNVDVIHDQAALLLGIGAIGCTAALALW